MDIEKNLILVKGKDKTENISHCCFENNKWQIEFGKDKTYAYNQQNVQWLKDPVSINRSTSVVYQNNHPLSGVDKIFDFGDYIRICFMTGYKKVYLSQEIRIEQSYLSRPDAKNIFEYLKQLSKMISVVDESNSSFLNRQYEKMTCVCPSSGLAKYLERTALHSRFYEQMPIPHLDLI